MGWFLPGFPDEIRLTKREWEVIISLLEREQDDLPAEIHVTRDSVLNARLRDRLQLVNELLIRLKDRRDRKMAA